MVVWHAVHRLAPTWGATAHALRTWARCLVAGLLLGVLVGCATTLSPYDKDAIDRTSDVSKAVYKYYQKLFALSDAQRNASALATLQEAEGDVETLMRLHLLREQARVLNDQSIQIATNLLASWQHFATMRKATNDPTALTLETLGVQRQVLERHLRAALVAEEAKKLGRPTSTTR
jgi:hypothetical protein